MAKKPRQGHRPKGHGPTKLMSKKSRAKQRELQKKVAKDTQKRLKGRKYKVKPQKRR